MIGSADDPPAAADRARPRYHTTTSGVLLAGCGVPLAVAAKSFGDVSDMVEMAWPHLSATIIAVLALLGGLTIVQWPRVGRLLATVAVLGALALGVPHLVNAPFVALASLLAVTAGLALLWKIGAPLIGASRLRRRPLFEGQAQGAAYASLTLWFVGVVTGSDHSETETLVVAGAFIISAIFALEWAARVHRSTPSSAFAVLGAVMLTVVQAALMWQRPWEMASSGVWLSLCSLVLIRPTLSLEMDRVSWWEPLFSHPERLFVGTFAFLCSLGTVLLALPQSASTGRSIGFMNAAFTSVSAVCVTGLTVLDTPVDFSGFGQVVILLLIQVGGLGIMTFSTVAIWVLGQRMSLRHEGAVASLLSTQDRGQLFATAKRILMLTFGSEAVGALSLCVSFMRHGDTLGTALWRGVFTSISAFCNAGFALQSTNLVPYQSAPEVLHVVAALIIVGGLSPMAAFAIPRLLHRADLPVSAQVKLGLTATAVLLAVGFFLILAFEWTNSLAGLSISDRINNAWFQSVTLRTAGFNSVDIAASHHATLTLMMLWMFIGGSPGGTAGGIKTTTAAILAISVVRVIRGQWTLEAFGKRISARTQTKATVITTVAAAVALFGIVTMQLTQLMPSMMAAFEVFSALGTVGLSIGGTLRLDDVGKGIIMACMFAGRVGGITLLMFVSQRERALAIVRPVEDVDVG